MADKNLPYDTGMLSFERSIQISEAFLYAARDDVFDAREDAEVTPIIVLEKGVRGQTSNDVTQEKLESEMHDKSGKSNIQTVHFAAIPQGHGALIIDFSIRVLPLSLHPHACDNHEVGRRYRALASAYSRAGGYALLAERYVWNIANGRFAWRNRFQTDRAEVRVTWNGKTIAFNPLQLDLDEIDDRAAIADSIVSGTATDLDELIETFAMGLKEKATRFSVRWIGEMGPGEEVFPSQEYLREEVAKQSRLSRVYASVPLLRNGKTENHASMHSQKIGAAIRHIDNSHGSEEYGAIAVNPYGGIQQTSEILRDKKTRRSFYDLRRNTDLMTAISNAVKIDDLPEDAHFLFANLVRGGVYGEAGTKQSATARKVKSNDG